MWVDFTEEIADSLMHRCKGQHENGNALNLFEKMTGKEIITRGMSMQVITDILVNMQWR
jgi:hypothetical protein